MAPAPATAPVPKPLSLATGAVVLGAAFLVLTLAAVPAGAQAPAAGGPLPAASVARPTLPATSPASAASAPRAAAKPAAKASAAAAPRVLVSKPTWAELAPAQQQALKPLMADWGQLTDAHKRKWLALSQNYSRMTPPEQATLHSRMTDWIALSPAQRTLARLNFAETKRLSPDDKRAKWEAYQALPPEEKQKLAATAAKPPGTAAAIKPVAPQKLATLPRPRTEQKAPHIAAAPSKVDNNTLLPQPAAAPVAPQSN